MGFVVILFALVGTFVMTRPLQSSPNQTPPAPPVASKAEIIKEIGEGNPLGVALPVSLKNSAEAEMVDKMPGWVKFEYETFKTEYADTHVPVAWGTGEYRGKPFCCWFGYYDEHTWLQMDVTVPLSERDLREMDALDVEVYKDAKLGDYATHIGAGVLDNWYEEYCPGKEHVKKCDGGRAFQKYLLEEANRTVKGLHFEIVGFFPLQ